jgi:uncharacterized membrane protein YbhN (UPF0104 family)
MIPPTIKEDGRRWTLENARPQAMRMVIGAAAPIALAAVGFIMWGDALAHHWVMFGVRALFGLMIILAARFALFGSESLAIEGDELVWRRGKQREACKLDAIEKLERNGNHLLVHVDNAELIEIGGGLRQPAAAMAWLIERVQSEIIAARKGTPPR